MDIKRTKDASVVDPGDLEKKRTKECGGKKEHEPMSRWVAEGKVEGNFLHQRIEKRGKERQRGNGRRNIRQQTGNQVRCDP